MLDVVIYLQGFRVESPSRAAAELAWPSRRVPSQTLLHVEDAHHAPERAHLAHLLYLTGAVKSLPGQLPREDPRCVGVARGLAAAGRDSRNCVLHNLRAV